RVELPFSIDLFPNDYIIAKGSACTQAKIRAASSANQCAVKVFGVRPWHPFANSRIFEASQGRSQLRESLMAERAQIIVVDDQSDALTAMLDALTRRFGADYRVVPYLSSCTALAGVRKSKEENAEIALVIAAQRMPEMTGREFLSRVRSIVPTAKRALLVEWGDREVSSTILQACALGELDNSLYKPWAPAEIHLSRLLGSS